MNSECQPLLIHHLSRVALLPIYLLNNLYLPYSCKKDYYTIFIFIPTRPRRGHKNGFQCDGTARSNQFSNGVADESQYLTCDWCALRWDPRDRDHRLHIVLSIHPRGRAARVDINKLRPGCWQNTNRLNMSSQTANYEYRRVNIAWPKVDNRFATLKYLSDLKLQCGQVVRKTQIRKRETRVFSLNRISRTHVPSESVLWEAKIW